MDSRLLQGESIKIHLKKEIKCNENSQIGGGQNRLKADSHSNFINSHTLPKIAISLALLLGGTNIAFAEESGGFVGIGIGGGGTEYKIEGAGELGSSADKFKWNGVNYGFVAGYKQFFNEYLGLRYYANLDIHHNLTKSETYNETTDTYENKRMDITLINYGVNVDFLGNFVVTEIADFGGFIGLGIGANSLTGKWIKDYKNAITESGEKFSDTAFDIWLNVGLRTNIAKYHGIELVARVPFLPVKMIDYSYDDAGITAKLKQTFKQTYSVLARYTFSF